MPKSSPAKLRLQKEINRRPEERKRRTKSTTERRRRGIAGKGGKDLGHTKSGKVVLVSRRKNRAANGKGKRSRYHA